MIGILRNRLLLTQEELAKEMCDVADPRTRKHLPSLVNMARRIRAHEGGEPVGARYAELYRRVWEKRRHELTEPGPLEPAEAQLAVDPLALAWTVGRLDQRVDRRTLLGLAAAAVTGIPALDPAERLMRVLNGHNRPDEEMVRHLEARTKGFHRLEEHMPAVQLYAALQTHLGEISALLEAIRSDTLRQRLAVAAGESAVLDSWFAWELGDARRAAESARLVGYASRAGDDPATAACMTGYQTYMTGNNPIVGMTLAQNALERLGESDLATRAWLLARLGEESALAGDKKTALKAIREAEQVYEEADIRRRPWTCFLDPARFASMTLSVYSRIREENRAVGASERVSAFLGPGTETKKLCVVQADMALAIFRLGDETEAVRFARQALDATVAMAAPLGWDRLDQVVEEFASSKSPATRGFSQEYTVTRPTTAPSSLL
ncbi:XRE family transcriptional regulator [Actinomadura hibisca]|uniref:XRE family transcriptional regulator n=1 Tax=Actinomadura hibisca TaxID=68565 RepID=UPI0012FC0ACF|nr:XRE family transcriptional regulator [Actinomadura hibisca]